MTPDRMIRIAWSRLVALFLLVGAALGPGRDGVGARTRR